MVPEYMNVSPPCLTGSSTTKIQPFIGFWQILPSASVTVAQTRPIAVVWIPSLGVSSLYSYCEMGATEVFPTGGTVLGLTLRFINKTFVPYTAGRNISIQPNPSASYIVGRNLSGFVHIRSDSTSTTTAALTGVISAGVLTDVRNASDINGPSLSQQTINKKECILAAKISDGVYAIQGPDIPIELGPVDWMKQKKWNNRLDQDSLGSLVATGGGAAVIVLGLLSPYLTTATGATVITTPYVGLQDAPCFDILCSTSSTSVPQECTLLHMFASWDDTVPGSVLTTVGETFMVAVSQANLYPVPAAALPGLPTETLYTSRPSLPASTIWVGTLLAVGASAGSTTTISSIVMSTVQNVANLGPARVFHVSNVAAGQQLVVSAKSFFEATPTAQFAPYMQPPSSVATNPALLPILQRLFDGQDQLYKRIYTKLAYLEASNYFSSLTAFDHFDNFSDWAEDSSRKRLRQ
jgi:hypothetical protein